MQIALPVAVKFLQKFNNELSKNLANFLSLAAHEYAFLLIPHIQSILESIEFENYGLCRVLAPIYDISPEQLLPHVTLLVSMLSKCPVQEKLSLLQLFLKMSQNKPTV